MQQALRVSDMTAFFNAEAQEGGAGKVGYLVEFNDTDKILGAPAIDDLNEDGFDEIIFDLYKSR